MGKPNKNKNAQNTPNSEMKIEEPEFKEKLDRKNLSAGDKKLLLQLERERKEQEEVERIKKEKAEAEKKKKSNKVSNKTKTKTIPPKNKEEDKPEPKSINTRNEIEKPKNTQIETKEFNRTPNVKNTQHVDEDFNKTTAKAENLQDETEGDDSWSQENTSTSNECDEAWNWTNGKNKLPIEGSKWRDEKKLSFGKPNYSNRQSGNYGNSSYGRSSYGYTLNDGKNDEEFQKFYNYKKILSGKVREEKGDLFDAPNEYSLAHCVAEDFSMGAGIAKEFKARFKRVSHLLDQNVKTGGLAILDDKDRFIYYLVTKQVSRGKPTLYTLWKSLLKLRDHITENKVTKLAIPQIGCGLDRLDWIDVKRMLEYVFSKNEIDIVVYILNFNAEETLNPSRTLRKGIVKHAVQPLTDMQTETGLIFFGTEDGAVSHEMECLAKKFDFLNRYKVERKSTCDVIKIVVRSEYLYGLIVRRTINNKINFTDFEKCLFNLRKMLKTDQTVYIALQAFVEKDDEVITDKLVNLMQYILQDTEIWVCWPQELAKYCPPQKQY